MTDRGKYDEDGLRVKWDSAPSALVRDLRADWLNMDLKEKISWTQGGEEVHVLVKVPPGTRRSDLQVGNQALFSQPSSVSPAFSSTVMLFTVSI